MTANYLKILVILLSAASLHACRFLPVWPEADSPGAPATNTPPEPLQAIPTSGLKEVRKHSAPVLALKVLDSKALTVGADGKLISWDLRTGKGFLRAVLSDRAENAAISPSSRLVALTSGTRVTVHDLLSGKEMHRLERVKTRFSGVVFHAQESALVLAGIDGRVYRWKFVQESRAPTFEEKDRALERYIRHGASTTAVLSHPFDGVFFSGDMQGAIYAWLPYDIDTAKGEYDQSIFPGLSYADKSVWERGSTTEGGVALLTGSTDGSSFVVGTETGKIDFWDVRGFYPKGSITAHRGLITAIALLGTEHVVSAGRDGKVRVHRVSRVEPKEGMMVSPTVELNLIYEAEFENVRSIQFVDPATLVAGTAGGELAELKLLTQKSLTPTPTPVPLVPERENKDDDY